MSPMRSGVKSLRVSWTEPIVLVKLIDPAQEVDDLVLGERPTWFELKVE